MDLGHESGVSTLFSGSRGYTTNVESSRLARGFSPKGLLRTVFPIGPALSATPAGRLVFPRA